MKTRLFELSPEWVSHDGIGMVWPVSYKLNGDGGVWNGINAFQERNSHFIVTRENNSLSCIRRT
jgi:hypothetical protein